MKKTITDQKKQKNSLAQSHSVNKGKKNYGLGI